MLLEFLKEYWVTIVFVLGVAIYIGYLAFKRRWSKIRDLAYKFIRQAEETVIGTKMGQERFNIVLTQLYNLIPAWLKFFIPRSLMEQKLQKWFDLIKDSLDDGKINNSTGELPKPPYYGTEKYYQAQFSQEDHERLYSVLRDIKGKFILSYNNCEYIWERYENFYIEAIERNNSLTARYESKDKKYGEVIISNY